MRAGDLEGWRAWRRGREEGRVREAWNDGTLERNDD